MKARMKCNECGTELIEFGSRQRALLSCENCMQQFHKEEIQKGFIIEYKNEDYRFELFSYKDANKYNESNKDVMKKEAYKRYNELLVQYNNYELRGLWLRDAELEYDHHEEAFELLDTYATLEGIGEEVIEMKNRGWVCGEWATE